MALRELCLIALAAGALVLAFTSGGSFARAAELSATNRTQLLYSADDKLCNSFSHLVDKLHTQHPNAHYISEVRWRFYRHTDFKLAPWIGVPDPEFGDLFERNYGFPTANSLFNRTTDGYSWGGAFFRANIAGDGVQRLVHIWHSALGHHGNYTSDIWILKPGSVYRTVQRVYSPANQTATRIDPDIVDLHVDFNGAAPPGSPFPYPSVKFPDQRFEFPEAARPTEDVVKLLRILFGGHGRYAQEAFSFGGRIYFAAGPPLAGYSLVYRITPQMTVQAVCVTINIRGFEELKDSKLWR